MTISEWLLLVQTLVFFGTGIAVVWYTLETRRARQRLEVQNELLLEQLKVAIQNQVTEQLKNVEQAQPLFEGDDVTFSGNNAVLRIRNRGSGISELSTEVNAPARARVRPSRFLPEGGLLVVELSDLCTSGSPEVAFLLRYRDRNGSPRATRVRYVSKENECAFERVDA